MKRYVMTKDKTIYDTTKMPTVNFDLDASVDKSTDNLIDLLELGDCVEDNDNYIKYCEHHGDIRWSKANVNNLQAIWKRQGDTMRRYEV